MSDTNSSSESYIVRRLTPTECERLQGFPDGWTDIPWNGKEHPPDGPRYKAIGNSFAVPVVRWIGERIQMVEGEINLCESCWEPTDEILIDDDGNAVCPRCYDGE